MLHSPKLVSLPRSPSCLCQMPKKDSSKKCQVDVILACKLNSQLAWLEKLGTYLHLPPSFFWIPLKGFHQRPVAPSLLHRLRARGEVSESSRHATQESGVQEMLNLPKTSCDLLQRPNLMRPLPMSAEEIRRPHSTNPKVVQGKCPLHLLHLNGVVCSNTLFSNTSVCTNNLSFRAILHSKVLEYLIWSNTSGFQFWGPLARTNFLSSLCCPPNKQNP